MSRRRVEGYRYRKRGVMRHRQRSHHGGKVRAGYESLQIVPRIIWIDCVAVRPKGVGRIAMPSETKNVAWITFRRWDDREVFAKVECCSVEMFNEFGRVALGPGSGLRVKSFGIEFGWREKSL